MEMKLTYIVMSNDKLGFNSKGNVLKCALYRYSDESWFVACLLHPATLLIWGSSYICCDSRHAAQQRIIRSIWNSMPYHKVSLIIQLENLNFTEHSLTWKSWTEVKNVSSILHPCCPVKLIMFCFVDFWFVHNFSCWWNRVIHLFYFSGSLYFT